MKKKFLYIIAAVCVTAWIFSNSLQNADASTISSGKIVDAVYGMISNFGVCPNRSLLVVIVRKCAHVTEFALQGLLLSACFEFPKKHRGIYVLFFGLLTACADEYIQYFVPGRGSLVQDVFIDFAGTIIGTCAAWILCRIKRR